MSVDNSQLLKMISNKDVHIHGEITIEMLDIDGIGMGIGINIGIE